MNTLLRFAGFDCRVDKAYYPNGRIALQLVATRTTHNFNQDVGPGEPIAVASVNLPEIVLNPNEVILKGWSENQGLPELLESTGVVRFTGRTVTVAQHGTVKITAPVAIFIEAPAPVTIPTKTPVAA